MRLSLTLVFGLIPAMMLGALALVPLAAGAMMLFDEPQVGLMLITWSVAGLLGMVGLFQVGGESRHPTVIPFLIAGIAAAAPLVVFIQDAEFPAVLFLGYCTVSPILVAVWGIAERMLGFGNELRDQGA